MTENTLAYARCSADTSLEEGLLLPPGWEVEVLANLTQVRGMQGWYCLTCAWVRGGHCLACAYVEKARKAPSPGRPSLPLAFLLRTADTGQRCAPALAVDEALLSAHRWHL